MYDFTYAKPTSIPDAVKALRDDPSAKPLAGGQTYIPVLKQRMAQPSSMVDLKHLGLSGITDGPGVVTIAALTTHHDIATSAIVLSKLPALAEQASWIGDTQVRHRGTIGGSLANNDPSACYPSAALALAATIKTDRREISADDYFQGMFTTALGPDEIVTAVTFPVVERAAYEKFRNPASRYAMVGVFVAKHANGAVRVAVTGAGQDGVFRHTAMEQALAANFSPDAIKNIKTPAEGLNGDIHASADYRAHLIGVMAQRAVAKALR